MCMHACVRTFKLRLDEAKEACINGAIVNNENFLHVFSPFLFNLVFRQLVTIIYECDRRLSSPVIATIYNTHIDSFFLDYC